VGWRKHQWKKKRKRKSRVLFNERDGEILSCLFWTFHPSAFGAPHTTYSIIEKNAFHALRFLPSPLFVTFLFISSSGGPAPTVFCVPKKACFRRCVFFLLLSFCRPFPLRPHADPRRPCSAYLLHLPCVLVANFPPRLRAGRPCILFHVPQACLRAPRSASMIGAILLSLLRRPARTCSRMCFRIDPILFAMRSLREASLTVPASAARARAICPRICARACAQGSLPQAQAAAQLQAKSAEAGRSEARVRN
jgi:hypothetical protein